MDFAFSENKMNGCQIPKLMKSGGGGVNHNDAKNVHLSWKKKKNPDLLPDPFFPDILQLTQLNFYFTPLMHQQEAYSVDLKENDHLLWNPTYNITIIPMYVYGI